MKYTAAVITVSDRCFRGEKQDTSGPALCKLLGDMGIDVIATSLVPDEKDLIARELVRCADELHATLVLATGGTGFSPRDITPEATRLVIEREVPGIPEAMRQESLRITPRGCLSRGIAGIRGRTLIIDLPGSEKAARENLLAVSGALTHGLDMLLSAGSANCAEEAKPVPPSLDEWLREAKAGPEADKCGMYLFHTGVVRETPRSLAREGVDDGRRVKGMMFDFDKAKTDDAISQAKALPGIYCVRVCLARGELAVGDTIMTVLIGGDIRPHVEQALDFLVGRLKSECVSEREILTDI